MGLLRELLLLKQKDTAQGFVKAPQEHIGVRPGSPGALKVYCEIDQDYLAGAQDCRVETEKVFAEKQRALSD